MLATLLLLRRRKTASWFNLVVIPIHFAVKSFTWSNFVVNFVARYVPAVTRLVSASFLLHQQQNKSNLSLDSAKKLVKFLPFSSSVDLCFLDGLLKCFNFQLLYFDKQLWWKLALFVVKIDSKLKLALEILSKCKTSFLFVKHLKFR